ncbi:hypothetical protein C7271_01105 [filamentous cyanobacterium CCP5]|nr:hypothetical protein C7271_01105 [filamentous cyanobacterium CCP5]
MADATAESPRPAATASDNKLLKAAWDRQNAYSKNASRYQDRFVFLRGLLAVLSVLVVVLSVLEGRVAESIPLNAALLVLPIVITALLAFSVKFDRGQNWILLRGNAESLKMEIFYYRTRVGPYAQNRDAQLAERIKKISERIRGSPVHQGALAPYEADSEPRPSMGILVGLAVFIYSSLATLLGKLWQILFRLEDSKPEYSKDDKYSDLDNAEAYINYRLNNQFNWYRSKAKELARQVQFFQTGIYFFGGLGTLLAATENLKGWVAVTAAMTGALTNYLEFKRVEASLVGYNQAADALYDIRAWWYSLPTQERNSSHRSKSFRKLVQNCEETIRSEHSSWLQDMQDRLSNLYGSAEDDANGNADTTMTASTTVLEDQTVKITQATQSLAAEEETQKAKSENSEDKMP